jgi:hypothetical protein
VRAPAKGAVRENLRVSKTEAHQKETDIERGCTFSIAAVPPLGQVWTSRLCSSLQGEKHSEKTEVTPNQTRKLGLNGRTGEPVGRQSLPVLLPVRANVKNTAKIV